MRTGAALQDREGKQARILGTRICTTYYIFQRAFIQQYIEQKHSILHAKVPRPSTGWRFHCTKYVCMCVYAHMQQQIDRVWPGNIVWPARTRQLLFFRSDARVCVFGEAERRPPFRLFAFDTSLYTTQAVFLSVLWRLIYLRWDYKSNQNSMCTLLLYP